MAKPPKHQKKVEVCQGYENVSIRQESFKTEDELEAAIRHEWDQKPATLLTNLYASMFCRLDCVIDAKGGPTRY